LRTWLGSAEEIHTLATSALSEVELLRAARRVDPEAVRVAEQLVADVHQVSLTRSVLATAGRIDPQALRSLEALHLATALEIGTALAAFVAYDTRLLAAATAAGLPTISPA
jgi:predicted nucleic acid-binding protein